MNRQLCGPKNTTGNNNAERAFSKNARKLGYFVMKRGWPDFFAFGENGRCIFVEVKSVRVPAFGSGEERISYQKKRNIIKTAYAYLRYRPDLIGLGVRFDVVTVNFERAPATIIHYTGAFYDTK